MLNVWHSYLELHGQIFHLESSFLGLRRKASHTILRLFYITFPIYRKLLVSFVPSILPFITIVRQSFFRNENDWS